MGSTGPTLGFLVASLHNQCSAHTSGWLLSQLVIVREDSGLCNELELRNEQNKN